MDLERAQELWSQYLDGVALPRAAEDELLAAMAADIELRERLLKDERLHGMLRAVGQGRGEREAFARSVADRLAAEKNSRGFISGVRRKVQAEVSAKAIPVKFARTPRLAKSPRRARPSAWSTMMLGVAAMAALALLGLLYSNWDAKRYQIASHSVPEGTFSKFIAIGRIVNVNGDVVVVQQNRPVAANSGLEIASGTGLEAGAGGQATVELNDGTRFDLRENSVLKEISAGENGKHVTLSSGTLNASVAKQEPGKPLIVTTANAEIKVIGTKFGVTLSAGSTRLEVEEGQVRLTRLPDRQSVAVQRGQYVEAGGANALTVKTLVRSGDAIATEGGPIYSLSFSSDARYLAAGCYDNSARIFDLQGGEPVKVLKGFTDRVRAVEFSKDGKYLATGSWDRTVKVWDAASTTEIFTAKCGGQIWSLAFSPDSRTLATGDFSRNLSLWKSDSGESIAHFIPHISEVLAISWSPDGKSLACGGTGLNIKLYDARTPELAERTVMQAEGVVLSLAYSPGSSLLASAQGNTIKLWDAVTGKLQKSLHGHTADVRCVRFTLDGQTLISSSDDTTVRLWNAQTGNELATLTDHTEKVEALAVSPNGDIFATGSHHDIRIWHLDRIMQQKIKR